MSGMNSTSLTGLGRWCECLWCTPLECKEGSDKKSASGGIAGDLMGDGSFSEDEEDRDRPHLTVNGTLGGSLCGLLVNGVTASVVVLLVASVMGAGGRVGVCEGGGGGCRTLDFAVASTGWVTETGDGIDVGWVTEAFCGCLCDNGVRLTVGCVIVFVADGTSVFSGNEGLPGEVDFALSVGEVSFGGFVGEVDLAVLVAEVDLAVLVGEIDLAVFVEEVDLAVFIGEVNFALFSGVVILTVLLVGDDFDEVMGDGFDDVVVAFVVLTFTVVSLVVVSSVSFVSLVESCLVVVEVLRGIFGVEVGAGCSVRFEGVIDVEVSFTLDELWELGNVFVVLTGVAVFGGVVARLDKLGGEAARLVKFEGVKTCLDPPLAGVKVCLPELEVVDTCLEEFEGVVVCFVVLGGVWTGFIVLVEFDNGFAEDEVEGASSLALYLCGGSFVIFVDIIKKKGKIQIHSLEQGSQREVTMNLMVISLPKSKQLKESKFQLNRLAFEKRRKESQTQPYETLRTVCTP